MEDIKLSETRENISGIDFDDKKRTALGFVIYCAGGSSSFLEKVFGANSFEMKANLANSIKIGKGSHLSPGNVNILLEYAETIKSESSRIYKDEGVIGLVNRLPNNFPDKDKLKAQDLNDNFNIIFIFNIYISCVIALTFRDVLDKLDFTTEHALIKRDSSRVFELRRIGFIMKLMSRDVGADGQLCEDYLFKNGVPAGSISSYLYGLTMPSAEKRFLREKVRVTMFGEITSNNIREKAIEMYNKYYVNMVFIGDKDGRQD